MTEFKGLDEQSQEKVDTFFNSLIYRKFLTEFTIGANKLKFYGLPLTMLKYSELIKTVITKDGPYFLVTHGTVYEKPMTVIWIYLNDVIESNYFDWLYDILNYPNLNLDEYLQLGRLINYFDIRQRSFIKAYETRVGAALEFSTTEDKKVFQTHKVQLGKIIGNAIDKYLEYDTIKIIFDEIMKKAPELIDELKILPIYDENNEFVQTTDRNGTVPAGYELVSIEPRMVKVKHAKAIPWQSLPLEFTARDVI